ncbi:MAG: hypothetical protein OWS74_07630 [Firmicutes bacterium]|nr:hypothetical protein [Bacillota bacterium]
MRYLIRGLLFVFALIVTISGGIREAHHHLWAGGVMAIAGLVLLMVALGAQEVLHIDQSEE